MLRQGCCTRWTSHPTQHIHFLSRNHNSKLLESIKMIPALCGCDCLDGMVWEFPVQLLRVPDTHTPLMTLTSLSQGDLTRDAVTLQTWSPERNQAAVPSPELSYFHSHIKSNALIPHVLYSLPGQQLAAVTWPGFSLWLCFHTSMETGNSEKQGLGLCRWAGSKMPL